MIDREIEKSLDQAHTKWILLTVLRYTLAAITVTSAGAYACERSGDSVEQARATRAHEEAVKAMWEHQKVVP